jgi:hypothetical protein
MNRGARSVVDLLRRGGWPFHHNVPFVYIIVLIEADGEAVDGVAVQLFQLIAQENRSVLRAGSSSGSRRGGGFGYRMNGQIRIHNARHVANGEEEERSVEC